MTTFLDTLEDTAAEIQTTVSEATVAIGRNARGSGVVVGRDRVLTNAHNLRDRTSQVTFADGRAAQATLLAADRSSDLAVLEVDTDQIVPVEWSDADAGVGAAVFAVARSTHGSRLSIGFVSGVGRTFRGPGGRRIGGGLEHTAPMGRGSSGGPLVNAAGRLVGLNTHRLGEGFYLAQATSTELRRRIDALLDGREPVRVELGVAVAPAGVAAKLRRSVGLDECDGVLIRGVSDGSPAERADLRAGDLIVAVGDVAIASVDDLHRTLAGQDVSSEMSVRFVRGAEEMTCAVSFVDGEPSAGSA